MLVTLYFRVLKNVGLKDTVDRASHINNANGDVYGTQWGGWLSSFIRRNTPSMPSMPDLSPYATISWVNRYFVSDVRMGENESGILWGAMGGTLPAGYVLTGGNFDNDREWPVYAPVQKNINGIWFNVTKE